MQALLKGRDAVAPVHLREWLRHADEALRQLEKHSADPRLARHNQLSQLNVLTQIEHLKTYAMVQQRVSAGTLRLHGWWFELHNADVYAYDDSLGRFVVIDEPVAERLLQQLDS